MSELRPLVEAVEQEAEADVFLYIGPIRRAVQSHFIANVCPSRPKHERALLMIETPGGDAHAAYSMASCLQQRYPEGFSLFTDNFCVSAGTLMALGAEQIILSDTAQLGPLDVQLELPDELGLAQSGLVPFQALRNLHSEAFDLWEQFFTEIKGRSGGNITTRTAADLASTMTCGLMAELYKQLDPLRLGDVYRSIQVAEQYGLRLQTANVKPLTLKHLIHHYSDHGFVINRPEAEKLFVTVRAPTDSEAELAGALTPIAMDYFRRSLHGDDDPMPYITNLSEWAASETDSPEPEEPEAESKEHERQQDDGISDNSDERNQDGAPETKITRNGSGEGESVPAGVRTPRRRTRTPKKA